MICMLPWKPSQVVDQRTPEQKPLLAPIEKLKADAGIQGEVEISRKCFERVSEIFHRILIDLPLDEFESIEFESITKM